MGNDVVKWYTIHFLNNYRLQCSFELLASRANVFSFLALLHIYDTRSIVAKF